MAEIYIAFVDTPGLFAGIIRSVLKQKYVHVVLSLDPCLDEAYSIGRRHPSVPLIAGFEKEDKRKIFKAFPSADYMICSIECTQEQKKRVEEKLQRAMKSRFSYHYAIIGLPFILMNRPFFQKGCYTCSSFSARILEETGICSFGKHFSLVTPKDFFEYKKKKVIFEGSLRELMGRSSETADYRSGKEIIFTTGKTAFAGEAYMQPVLKRGMTYER